MGKNNKGISFLATYNVDDIRKGRRISHFAVPSKYRKFSIRELYKSVIILRPDYKGKYAFSYSEIGWGIDIGVSIDFVKLITQSLLPFHVELGITGGGDKIGELVILLSRPHQGKANAHEDAPKDLLTDFPLCLQSFIGNRYNFRIKASAGANIKFAPALELGKGNLAFTLGSAELSFSGGIISYKLKEKNPGWYESKSSKFLQKDVDNLISLGLGKSLREDATTWVRDHIKKRIVTNLLLKLQKNNSRSVHIGKLKKRLHSTLILINKLPPSGFFARIKEHKLFKKSSEELIALLTKDLKPELEGLKEDLTKANKLDTSLKIKYRKRIEEVIITLNWYTERIDQARQLALDSKSFDRLPVKLGNAILVEPKTIYEDLCYAELTCYGPFQTQLKISAFDSILKPHFEEEVPKAKKEESNGFQKPEFSSPTLTDLPFKLGQKATRKLGLERINSTIGTSNLYNFSRANSRYQTYGITKEKKIIFTQDTKIRYSNLQFQMEADFWAHLNKKDDRKESIKSDYILNKDGSIKAEVVHVLKKNYPDFNSNRIDNYEKLRSFMKQKVQVKNKRNITGSGSTSNTGIQGSISFNQNSMSYKAVSAYWLYPENQADSNTVSLEEGSGISFGISIQLEELNRIIETYSEVNNGAENSSSIDPGIKRISSMLRLDLATIHTFIERLYKTVEENRPEWDRMKNDGEAILMETAFVFKNKVAIKIKEENEEATKELQKLSKHEQIHAILDGGKKGNEESEKLDLTLESIRLRYRLADSKKDDSTFKIGLDIGIGIKIGLNRYKRAGNEAIQDYLVYTLPNKEFYFGQFPSEYLDRTVPPVMLLPHSFPEDD